jgi:hypothetical protein
LDPEEVCLFYGDRVETELSPGFQELFSSLLRDVLTVAVNQVARYAKGDRPGTGPGMREFPWTTTHRDIGCNLSLGRHEEPVKEKRPDAEA